MDSPKLSCIVRVCYQSECREQFIKFLSAYSETSSFLFRWCIGLLSDTFKGDAAFEVFKPLLLKSFDVYPVVKECLWVESGDAYF